VFNRSLTAGRFPLQFKEPFITPIIIKPSLDAADVRSYRPISNLSVVSKLLERVMAGQLVSYLRSLHLFPSCQSGFRAGHSTETAVLRVLLDLSQAFDSGKCAALVLQDLLAAFDTADHAILLKCLWTTFGLNGLVLKWFQSYLSGQTQYVRRGSTRSSAPRLKCGILQGSVLGPILFILYTVDLIGIVEQHGFRPHLYADDTQVYGSCTTTLVDDFQLRLSVCVDNIAGCLQIVCSSTHRQNRAALVHDGAVA
jgi:hypothetical protein